MATRKSLDLEAVVTNISYRKSETLTETAIRQAINEAILSLGVEYVSTLPTGDNIKQKVYLVPDPEGQSENMCDVWVYDFTNTRWVHVDALKFNINDYLKIADIVDNLTSTNTNKALSANQGKELKTLIDGKSANTHVHGSVNNNGTLNSDISSVNKVVVTDSNNNLKTISTLPSGKVTHQDITGKVSKNNGASEMTDTNIYTNLGTTSGATQQAINSAINSKLTTITLTVTYDDNTTGTFSLFGSEVIT